MAKAEYEVNSISVGGFIRIASIALLIVFLVVFHVLWAQIQSTEYHLRRDLQTEVVTLREEIRSLRAELQDRIWQVRTEAQADNRRLQDRIIAIARSP